MKSRVIISFLVIAFFATFSSLVTAKEEPPKITVDGLHLIEDSNLALVYAKPGANLSHYKRIYLVDAYVAFKKNWQRDQNRDHSNKIRASDMERIKSELAELFREVFTKTLEEGGYELVTERADDVLVVRPAIINLDVAAPDTMSAANVRSYSESVGEMTLYVELFDSVTDDIIAKALDAQRDRQTGYFQWQNRVTNKAAANRILKVWAEVLKNGLDQARAATSK